MNTASAQQHKHKRGFSLVELMVSLSIFAIVMIISVGTLLILIDANERAQIEYTAMTNLTFALDSMTREIRTGYDHYCRKNDDLNEPPTPLETGPLDCTGSNYDTEIAFNRGRDNIRVGYRLHNGEIQQRVGDEPWLSLTSPNLVVTRLDLQSIGSIPGDTEQPTSILYVEGYINNTEDTDTDFKLQTRITQRILGY